MYRLSSHPWLRANSEYCEKSRSAMDRAKAKWERRTRRRRLAMILCAACLAVGVVASIVGSIAMQATATEARAVTSVVFGKVVDERAVPVGPGAVSVFSDEYSLVGMGRIEDDGSYSVECSSDVSLLRFEIPSFHPEIRAVPVAREPQHRLDVAVGPTTSAIEGVVVDPVGIPVENARVVLFSQGQSACVMSAQTRNNGRFRLEVAAGDYIVSAWTASSVFRPESVSIGAHESVEIVMVALPADVRVSGLVLDGRQGGSVAGAKISAYTEDGRFVGGGLSDSSGHYVLYLPAGTWEIKVWKEGWTHVGERMVIDRGVLEVDHDVVLRPSDSQVSGHVLDGSGKPLPNAWIEVIEPESGGWAATASTDLSGRFSLDIASGVWDLSLMAEGHERTSVRVVVSASGGVGLAEEPNETVERLVFECAAGQLDSITVCLNWASR